MPLFASALLGVVLDALLGEPRRWHPLVARERLLALLEAGRRLVVDEAFVDALPEQTLTPLAGQAPDLIVLRSMGKFFGLAGARVGFAFASSELLARLRERIGPWSVTGPSRFVATTALRDTAWQAATRKRLAHDATRLAGLLAPLGEVRSHPLFAYISRGDAADCAEFLARRGILVRHFYAALRCGLPDTDAAWNRLDAAIRDFPASSVDIKLT